MLELFKHFPFITPPKMLKESFSELENDAYIHDRFNFRKRAYGRCLINKG